MSIAQQRIENRKAKKEVLEKERVEAHALKAQGYSNAEISEKLGLAEGTVLNLLAK